MVEAKRPIFRNMSQPVKRTSRASAECDTGSLSAGLQEVNVPGAGTTRQGAGSTFTLRAFVGIMLAAMVLTGVATSAILVLTDRFARPELVIGEAALPTMVAQIDGAVATPGAYPLPAGARLDDLLTAAGGLTGDADVGELNLAARIGDGEKVVIPAIDRATPEAPTPQAADHSDAPLTVPINTATLAELDTLPGIGPVIGQRIISYRESNGPYQSLDELVEIDGISANLLATLRPHITLDD